MDNVIVGKSLEFAVKIVNAYKTLCKEQQEYVLSKQLLRSGTSIGANVREGVYAQSKSDFIAKMSIALKEAAETQYWLELLKRTEYLTGEEDVFGECDEVVKILTAIVKRSKEE